MDQEQPDAKNRKRQSFSFKNFVPFLVFLFLVCILFLSSRFTSPPPEIFSVSPQLGESGGEMVITGKHFGSERNGGRIDVSGSFPPAASYIEWKDDRISFIIPDDMTGGLVKVMTKHGDSREIVPFTNKDHLPVVMAGPLNPGFPHIEGIEPKGGSVGTPITITGLNFGLKRGDSLVIFPWIFGSQDKGVASDDRFNTISAQDYDYDVVSWTDREIRIRVPDGASSGNVRIVTDKGQSNSVYFEVKDGGGVKLFGEKRIFHVQLSVEISDIGASNGNGLYLWVPRLLEGPEQREATLISMDPEPLFENFQNFMLFFLEDVEGGKTYRVEKDVLFSRYSVETKINAARINPQYDQTTRLYQSYTVSDALVPSNETAVSGLSSQIVGRERNPYRRAWLIYQFVINGFSHDETASDLMKALESRTGSALVYSRIFCALSRSAGIPARPVAGYIVDLDGRCIRHYWAEFYLENIGWIPVDLILGDGTKFGNFPTEIDVKNYYFGNLDNRHITITKGLVKLKQMNPKGRAITREGTASFQTIHEEYVGNLWSYTSRWNDLVLLGIY